MDELELACLGELQVTLGGIVLTLFQTDKSRALLSYLVLEPRIHQRVELAALLWPGYSEESARNNLRQTLHHLRQVLAKARPDRPAFPWFLLTRQTVQFNPAAPLGVDALRFRALLATCVDHAHVDLLTCGPCLERLRQAVDLYRGDFLANLTVEDSAPFEEWRHITQEQFQRQLLYALSHIAASAEASGDDEQAIQAAQRRLTIEPWHEDTHRQIIRLLAQRGQYNTALAQYQRCRQVLMAMMGVEPDAATTALAEAISAGKWHKGGHQPTTPASDMAKLTTTPLTVQSAIDLAPADPVPTPLGPLDAPPLGGVAARDSTPSAPHAVPLLHNLPIAISPIVGRTRSLAEVVKLLRQARLLTLVGPGGMGKTRLAVEVGKRLFDECVRAVPQPVVEPPANAPEGAPLHFPQGIWFVSLAAISSATALPGAIIAALALPLPAGDPRATLLQSLRTKQLLLILDNFEHLLGEEAAVDLVVALLETAPGVQILITSRQRLNLRSEQIYPVPPLSFVPTATLAEASGLAAVRLFVQAVQRVQPDFALTAATLPAVLRICQAVQAMPLGLELAAAQANTLPLATLADAISQSAALLAVDWHDLPARQRSMRAVFAWSWRLLTAAEQRALRQISLFHGGFDQAAAQAVAEAPLSVLTRLIHQSLLQRQESATGTARFLMHELLRQFAAEALAQAGAEERSATRLRYAHYYINWISQQTANGRATGRARVHTAMQQEWENCRQAWSVAVEERRLDLIAVGLPGFVYLWRNTGRLVEGERLLVEALQAFANRAEATPQQQATVAALLVEQAAFLHLQYNSQQAIAVAQLAIQKAEACGAVLPLVCGLLILAGSAKFIFDLTIDRRTILQRALDLARAHRLGRWEVDALIRLAAEYGELDQQLVLLKDALRRAQSLADPALEILALSELSGTFENHGQCARALPYRQKIAELAEAFGDVRTQVDALYNYASTYHFLGCYPKALALGRQALAKAHTHQLVLMEIVIGEELASLYWAMGEVEQAYATIMAARQLAADDPAQSARLDYTYARILASRGEWTAAAELAHNLLTRHQGQPATAAPHRLRDLNLLAQLYHQAGGRATALAYTEAMLQILANHPQIDLSAVNWELFAIYWCCYEVLHSTHDPRAALVLQRGYQALQCQAAHIDAPDLRQSFLENICAHRNLVAAWQAQAAQTRQLTGHA